VGARGRQLSRAVRASAICAPHDGWLCDGSNAWGDELPMIEKLHEADEARPH